MQMMSFRASLSLAFTFVFGFSATNAEDWLQWRGADRANHSSETGLFDSWGKNGPTLKWMAEGIGDGYASVSVAGNRIYTTGNFEDSQSAVAIDATTGDLLWKQAIASGPPSMVTREVVQRPRLMAVACTWSAVMVTSFV